MIEQRARAQARLGLDDPRAAERAHTSAVRDQACSGAILDEATEHGVLARERRDASARTPRIGQCVRRDDLTVRERGPEARQVGRCGPQAPARRRARVVAVRSLVRPRDPRDRSAAPRRAEPEASDGTCYRWHRAFEHLATHHVFEGCVRDRGQERSEHVDSDVAVGDAAPGGASHGRRGRSSARWVASASGPMRTTS